MGRTARYSDYKLMTVMAVPAGPMGRRTCRDAATLGAPGMSIFWITHSMYLSKSLDSGIREVQFPIKTMSVLVSHEAQSMGQQNL